MKKHYRVVIFDWEGTLGDTVGAVLSAIAEAAEACEFGTFDEPLARRSLGLGLPLLLKKLFPTLPAEAHILLASEVQLILSTAKTKIHLLPGSRALVERLAKVGCKLAIATNKRDTAIQRDLIASQLNDLIQVTRSADQTMPKPAPQMLEEILLHFDVAPEEALMVGDSEADMQMARSIGVDAVGIDVACQHEQSLSSAGAMAVFTSYESLTAYLFNEEEHGP